MLKGNKGEWSEIYTLLKLLGDQEIYPGDENLNKIAELVYPIIKILRTETSGNFEYTINKDIVLVTSDNKELTRVPIITFKEQAKLLFEEIKKSKHTFELKEVEEFLNSIHCESLKASSSAKTDITIMIHDEKTRQTPTLGFSIKSQLGNPSTLLNAGKSTNFIYKITGLDLEQNLINEINSIETRSKIKDRLKRIQEEGGSFQFTGTEKSIFSNNLILIDSLLPDIISEMVFQYYSSGASTVSELVKTTEELNPLNFNQEFNHQFYSYKTKRFLTDVALGMMPATVWTGKYDATGGYLIVKPDGDIRCYHIYNRNDFENYLLNNTRLETASSSRHKFGKIYEEDGELFFKLNLQIRFLK